MKSATIFLADQLHEQTAPGRGGSGRMAEWIRLRQQDSPGWLARRGKSQDPILNGVGVCRGPVLSEGIDEALYGL